MDITWLRKQHSWRDLELWDVISGGVERQPHKTITDVNCSALRKITFFSISIGVFRHIYSSLLSRDCFKTKQAFRTIGSSVVCLHFSLLLWLVLEIIGLLS
jgi:hypothetical protein